MGAEGQSESPRHRGSEFGGMWRADRTKGVTWREREGNAAEVGNSADCGGAGETGEAGR